MTVNAGPNGKVRAVGIDLSLTGTGVALHNGECTLVGEAGVTNMPVRRQLAIVNDLSRRIHWEVTRGAGDVVVIEGLDMARSYGGQIERTALWWNVVERLSDYSSRPILVAPSALLKIYATGKANATKANMVAAVATQWPMFDTRGNDNLADAAVACAMASHWAGQPLAELPEEHARALAKLRSIDDPPPVRRTNRRAT